MQKILTQQKIGVKYSKMNMDKTYDPITLNHWLWFKIKCHEASGTDFQSLFENIIKRAKPEFVAIRPYGNIGDRKSDGLFECGETIFQVYSPDELTQKETQDKIEEDLAGAISHWSNKLKKWVFVYNVRRGLPPDIPMLLAEQQKTYPNVKIDYLSNDHLWEMARCLTLQQRAEILGAPNGYEHLFLSPNSSSKEVENAIKDARFVIIQDVMSPINLESVAKALQPQKVFGAPFYLRPTTGELPWNKEAEYQKEVVTGFLQKTWDLSPRFTVFSLAPIPLALHLGFLLSNRAEVEYYQFDRDKKSWNWTDEEYDKEFEISGLPKEDSTEEEVVIRVSLSAKIAPLDTENAIGKHSIEIDLSVKNPDVMWLKNPEQLNILAQKIREILTVIRNKVPSNQKIHLFYAGPTGGAVIIGQQINPRMDASVATYQYSKQATPHYQFALNLEELNK